MPCSRVIGSVRAVQSKRERLGVLSFSKCFMLCRSLPTWCPNGFLSICMVVGIQRVCAQNKIVICLLVIRRTSLHSIMTTVVAGIHIKYSPFCLIALLTLISFRAHYDYKCQMAIFWSLHAQVDENSASSACGSSQLEALSRENDRISGIDQKHKQVSIDITIEYTVNNSTGSLRCGSTHMRSVNISVTVHLCCILTCPIHSLLPSCLPLDTSRTELELVGVVRS